MLDVIASCILHKYMTRKVKMSLMQKIQLKKNLNDFIESLNSKQFKEIQKFFDTMPKLTTYGYSIENPKTKVESEILH